MNEFIKFYKGEKSGLPKPPNIEPGAMYHCIDTGETFLGISKNYLKLYSIASAVEITTWSPED